MAEINGFGWVERNFLVLGGLVLGKVYYDIIYAKILFWLSVAIAIFQVVMIFTVFVLAIVWFANRNKQKTPTYEEMLNALNVKKRK